MIRRRSIVAVEKPRVFPHVRVSIDSRSLSLSPPRIVLWSMLPRQWFSSVPSILESESTIRLGSLSSKANQ
ncbi:hypothetical protein BC827DRAFT_541504 [Russula dissimulans]|nr:hypothetical protein BC827DRAFT_541504 [Russula dissimulans]